MSSSANLNQVHFRIRTDTGSAESTPTWAAAEDTGAVIAVETTFRIRFCVNNTGTATSTSPAVLRVSKNGGAYTAVTTTSGATLGAQSADASSDADASTFSTFRLTAGAGTPTSPGLYDEDGSYTGSVFLVGQYREIEFGLILKTAGAVAGNTFDFRIYNSTTAFTTYTQTPRITVPSPTLTQRHYRIRTDSGAVNSTPTWGALEDEDTYPGSETAFRIRFLIENTGTGPNTSNFIPRYSKNSGITFPNVITTSSSGGVQAVSASSDGDETALTTGNFVLTAGAGSAVAGNYDADGSSTATIAAASYSEHEFGLIFKAGSHAPGDTYDLRIYHGTSGFSSYLKSPSIYVPETPGSDFALKNYDLGHNQAYNASGNSSTVVTTTKACAVGDLVVVFAVTDNVTTTDADDNPISSITDSAGNTYTKAISYAQASGVAQDGVASAIWYSQLTSTLAAASSITVNWNDSATRDAVCVGTRAYTVASGKTVAVEATNSSVATATGPGSLSATTSNIECLRIRLIGRESDSRYLIRGNGYDTAGWVPLYENTAGGVGAASVSLAGEVQISTNTGAASNPTATLSSSDWCSVYVAFRADTTFSGHTCLANDVISASSVTTAAITQVHTPLANDVTSNSSVTQPAAVIRRDLLANDVLSASSVSVPAAVITAAPTALLANDVISGSSVTQPAAVIRRDILANDVKSNSSVGQPAVQQLQGLLANDVKSNSSVSQPAATIGRALLANDVISTSSVSQPAAIIGRTLLANDVLSGSSVSQPSAGIQRALLANDVKSNSSVTGPVLGILGQIDARDVTSASSVTQPAVHQVHGLLANDVKSNSSVSQPAALVLRGLLANDVVSASSVTQPAAGQIVAGQPLANDVISASFVSTPTLVVEGDVIPVPPELGGGGKVYGRGYPRRRWEELLRRLEQERREARQRAERFKGKDRARARKASAAASEAIARAIEQEEAEEQAAHAREITRLLEGASQAASLTAYLRQMEAVRIEAEEMQDEDDVETILMLVA